MCFLEMEQNPSDLFLKFYLLLLLVVTSAYNVSSQSWWSWDAFNPQDRLSEMYLIA